MERELSAGERVMWMAHQVGCANCVFTAHVSGDLDERALRTALDLLPLRHSLLGTRIEVRGRTPFFVSENVPPIPLRVILRQSDDDWHAEAERELNDSLMMSQGPLLRAVLIKSDMKSELIITCHHVIADAKSGVNLISELLDLAGQIVEGNPSPKVTALPEHPPVEEILPIHTRGLSGLLKAAAFISRQLSNALIQRPRHLPRDSDAMPQDCRARFVQSLLSAEETEALLVRCREQGTTVQGAVCAAVLKAVAGQIHDMQADDKPLTLTCASAVDLRSVLSRSIKDELGNFVSIAVTAHRVSMETPFWNLARAVKGDLRRAVGRGEPAVSLGLLDKFLPRKIKPADLMKRIAKFNSPVVATNLGVIDIPERYGPISLQWIHPALSMTAFPESFEVCIATYRNQLGMNFCYSEPALSRVRILKLAGDVTRTLRQAAALRTASQGEESVLTALGQSFPVGVVVS